MIRAPRVIVFTAGPPGWMSPFRPNGFRNPKRDLPRPKDPIPTDGQALRKAAERLRERAAAEWGGANETGSGGLLEGAVMGEAKRRGRTVEPVYYPMSFLAPLAGRADLPDPIGDAVACLEAIAERLDEEGPAVCAACDCDVAAFKNIAGLVVLMPIDDETADTIAAPVCAVCAADPMSILPKAAAILASENSLQ
jgi:hypothetical protein